MVNRRRGTSPFPLIPYLLAAFKNTAKRFNNYAGQLLRQGQSNKQMQWQARSIRRNWKQF